MQKQAVLRLGGYLRKLWIEQGYDLWGGKPEALAAQQAKDLDLWRGVTRDIKVD